jgi:hypothetical protein
MGSEERARLVNLFRVLSACACLAILAGCERREPAAPPAPARVLAASEVSAALGFAYTGDTGYAQVRSAQLPALYDNFRSEIFRQGVTKWDERFDCNHFAAYYVALAQTRFYIENFHAATRAQSLAVGVFWYHSTRGPHAIVCALTERGAVFIEPQNGREITLTPAERASAFLVAF